MSAFDLTATSGLFSSEADYVSIFHSQAVVVGFRNCTKPVFWRLMLRRDFITLLSGAVTTWSLAARAQTPTMPVIGFLGSASPEGYAPFIGGFLRGLTEAGFIDGESLGRGPV